MMLLLFHARSVVLTGLCLFSNSYFSSPDVLPTVEQIHHTFGPTVPGGKTVCMCVCCVNSDNPCRAKHGQSMDCP